MGQAISNRSAPARGVVSITKSDTDLAKWIRSLYVTGAGDVKITAADGTTATITVPANFILPVEISRVWSTGTTATGFVGFY